MQAAQARTEKRLDVVGTGLSEVRERLTSAETQQFESEKRIHMRLGELWQRLEEGLRAGGGRRESVSSGDRPTHSGSTGWGRGPWSRPQEHLVLLHFAELTHIGEMRGFEARYRSDNKVAKVPIATESKPFHDWLAVKFRTHEAAAKYHRILNDVFRDGEGRPVVVIHKGAKASRPPHISRRGTVLHPFYGVFTACICDGETLQPHYNNKGDTNTQFWAVSEGDAPRAHILGTAKWVDDGATNAATEVTHWHRSRSNGAKNRLKALLE